MWKAPLDFYNQHVNHVTLSGELTYMQIANSNVFQHQRQGSTYVGNIR